MRGTVAKRIRKAVYGDMSLRWARDQKTDYGTVYNTGHRRQYQKVKGLKHLLGKFREVVILKKPDGTTVRI